MLIFYLLLLVIPLLFVKKRKDDDLSIMDSYSTTCIKGVLCLYVVLHNLGLDYEGNSEAMELICEHTGGIGVGVFFFLSAFGIIRSYQHKGNKYLKKLLFVNVVKLYLISVSINLLTYFVFFQGSFETKDLLFRIFNLDVFNNFNRMNRHGWYISVIIGLYIIFAIVYYLCSKLKTKNKFIIAGFILAFISISFRIGAKIADNGGMYTREMPCFAIGCLYATYYDKVNNLSKKYYWPSIWITIVAFILGFIFFEPIGAYATCLFLIVVSQRITYKNNVTYFLGKLCIYIYLFVHFSSLVMQPFITNQYWWIINNLGLILELSLIFFTLEYGVRYLIKKLIKHKENIKIKEGGI